MSPGGGWFGKIGGRLNKVSVRFQVHAQYTAPLDSVEAALGTLDPLTDCTLSVVTFDEEVHRQLRQLNPDVSFQPRARPTSVVMAQAAQGLVGYWCFQRLDGDFHERGVFVHAIWRRRGLAPRLLKTLLENLEPAELSLAHRLLASAPMRHRASRRMLVRCGLRFEGVGARGHLPALGDFHLFFRPLD